MTENFEAPTLLGLTVLLAPAKTGKTEALRLLHRELGWPVYLHDEPAEPMNMAWPRWPIKDLDEYPSEGSSTDDDSEVTETLTEALVALDPIVMVDSYRTLLFEGGGGTLAGGISSGAIRKLTALHNALVDATRGVLAVINPLYSGKQGREMDAAVQLVSGSVGGVLCRPESLGDVDSTGWVTVRDRFDVLEPLRDFLSAHEEASSARSRSIATSVPAHAGSLLSLAQSFRS